MLHRLLFAVTALISTVLIPSTAWAGQEDICAAPFPITEITNQMHAQRILLLGEIHGTNEAPAIALATACAFSRKGLNVAIALEMPENLNDNLAAYFTDKKATVQDTILTSSYWSPQRADGRTSIAMLRLLENARELKNDGLNLSVVAIDIPWEDNNRINSYENRDRFMADRLKEIGGIYDKIILLAGNYHTRVLEAGSAQTASVPAYLDGGSYQSIAIDFLGGTGWFCGNAGCKAQEIDRPKNRAFPVGKFIESPNRSKIPYHGFIVLEKVTASAPASASTQIQLPASQ